MQFFFYEHLPEHLQEVSRPFAGVANTIDEKLDDNPQKTKMLEHLLESKDCAVRAVLFKP